jgi:hypothetical protein
MIRKLLLAATAFSMAASPVAAQAAAREATPVKATEHVAGVSTVGWIIALAIVAGTIAVIASDSHHHHPVSP